MSRGLALRLALFGVLAALVVTLPFWTTPYWTRIGTGAAMWAGLALSWNVIGGYMGYISFGQVAFFGIGAYATGLLMNGPYNWPFPATLPVGAVAAALVAALVGWPTLRLRGAYFAIATWAIAEVAFQAATVAGFTGGTFGLTLPGFVDETYFYYVMLAAAVASYIVVFFLLERSRFGYRVRAVRDNEIAAEMLGINTNLVKIEAFILSAILPAVFGGIFAYWITFINPASVLPGDYTDQMVVMVLLGGLGNIWGSAIGAVVLWLINRYFWANAGDTTAYIAIIGLIIAAVVLFLPDGLVSLWPGTRRPQLIRRLPGTLFGARFGSEENKPSETQPTVEKRGT